MTTPTSRARAAVLALLCSVVVTSCGGPDVPLQFRDNVRRAGRECPQVSAKLIAAQLEQESDWDPGAVSAQGAQGLAQFMPATWDAWGTDGDDDGDQDPFEPADAIAAQGRLMCHLVGLANSSQLGGDPVTLALAAYNAGWGPVTRYGGVPPFPETQDYVSLINERQRTIRLAG